MSSVAVIRARVERELPGALTVSERVRPETFATGIPDIDQQLGGIPQGAITQICTPLRISSGKTAVLASLVAQLTQREHFCALVDTGDCFDPASAEATGVDLAHLLWVRCGSKKRQKQNSLEQAFKAADILVQNGGFGLIAVDLGHIDEGQIRKIPLTTWFRFARVIESMPTALVFLTTYPAAQSCAGLTLHMKSASPSWSQTSPVGTPPHALALPEINFEIEVGRVRHKPVQSARPQFAAASIWA